MTVPAKIATAVPANIMEAVLMKGDLAAMTPQERVTYYGKVCQSIGVNPLTRPLDYINLNGKLTLYAKRDCTDQLRKLHNISVSIVSQEYADGLFSVHVRAKDSSGREDEDLGVVALSEMTKGESRANAILKAITKAKRRVTLSISGLGFLDETEVEDIPAAAKAAPPKSIAEELQDEIPFGGDAPRAAPAQSPPAPQAGAATAPDDVLAMAREAASHGFDILNTYYKTLGKKDQKLLNEHKQELESLFPLDAE